MAESIPTLLKNVKMALENPKVKDIGYVQVDYLRHVARQMDVSIPNAMVDHYAGSMDKEVVRVLVDRIEKRLAAEMGVQHEDIHGVIAKATQVKRVVDQFAPVYVDVMNPPVDDSDVKPPTPEEVLNDDAVAVPKPVTMAEVEAAASPVADWDDEKDKQAVSLKSQLEKVPTRSRMTQMNRSEMRKLMGELGLPCDEDSTKSAWIDQVVIFERSKRQELAELNAMHNQMMAQGG